MTKRIWIIGWIIAAAAAVTFAAYLSEEESSIYAWSPKSPITSMPINQTRLVDYIDADTEGFQLLSESNQLEQIRDWLLYSVLVEALDDAHEFADSTFDMPPLRRPHLESSAYFQHGASRSKYIGDGVVVALLPHEDTIEIRHDNLAQIADMHAMQQGDRPHNVLVFEYCIDLSARTATITQLDPIAGARLFSTEFGYVESRISGIEDLQAFVSQIDDVVSVQSSYDGMIVGGRDYAHREYGQVTAEHIATIYQAYQSIDGVQSQDGYDRGKLVQEWVKKLTDFRINSILSDPAEMARLAAQIGSTTIQVGVELEEMRPHWNKENEEEATKWLTEFDEMYGECQWSQIEFDLQSSSDPDNDFYKSMFERYTQYRSGWSEEKESLMRGAIGFSLDPEYDYDILRATYADFIHTSQFAELLTAEARRYIEYGLDNGDTTPVSCILAEVEDAGYKDAARAMNKALLDPGSYQTGRYDGGIQGTDVGQILYFTDLLAKLLKQDFDHAFKNYFEDESFPNQMDGFFPSVYTQVPVHYRKQAEELPSTRLWFGLKNNGSYSEGSTLRFSRVAVRVFALGNSGIAKTQERQPPYLSAKFVDWWNEHYDQVAGFEPAYDQLNQVVKWAYIVDWLDDRYSSPGFLSNYPVTRDHWFPDWVAQRSNGSPPDWLRCFHPRGRYSDDVETMQVAHSSWEPAHDTWCANTVDDDYQFWLRDGEIEPVVRTWLIRGGVSLPRARNAAGQFRSASLDGRPLLRRANLSDRGLTITKDDTNFVLRPEYSYQRAYSIRPEADRLGATISRRTERLKLERSGEWAADQGTVHMRGPTAEISDLQFNERLVFNPTQRRLSVESSVGESANGRTVFSTSGRAHNISQTSATYEKGQELGLVVSNQPPGRWTELLASDPRVDIAVRVDNGALVKLNGRNTWVELGLEAEPGVNIQQGWSMRVSRPQLFGNEAVVNVRPVSQDSAVTRLAGIRQLEIRQVRRLDGEIGLEVVGPPRQPPPPSSPRISFAGPGDSGGGRLTLVGRYDRSQNRTILDVGENSTSRDLDVAIGALRRTELDGALRPSGSNEIVLQTRNIAAEVNVESATALRNSARNAIDADPSLGRTYVDGIQEARSNFLASIRRSIDADQNAMTRDLLFDFNANFKLTALERVDLALRRAKAPSSEINDLTGIVSRTEGNVDRLFSELESWVRSGDPGTSALRARRAKFSLAESGHTRADREFLLSMSNDGSSVNARLTHPIEQRRISISEADNLANVYIDKSLSLRGSATTAELAEAMPDAIILQIRNPRRLDGLSVNEIRPDELTVGNFRFRRTPGAETQQATVDSTIADMRSLSGRVSRGLTGDGGGCADSADAECLDASPDSVETAAADEDDSIFLIVSPEWIGATCAANDDVADIDDQPEDATVAAN